MVGRNVYRTTLDGVEICHSYSRRLPALFEFLHVDITRQSHGLFVLAKHLYRLQTRPK